MTVSQKLKHFFLPLPLSGKVVKHLLKYMLIFMALVFFTYFMVQTNAIFRSGSSIDAIGFIFLPLFGAITAYKAWLFAFALAYLITVIVLDSPKLNVFFLICLLLLLRGVWGFSGEALDVFKSKLAIYEINMLHDSKKLDEQLKIVSIYPKEAQAFILEAMVLNPFTLDQTLDKIARIDDPTLENRLNSLFYFQAANSKGFSVKRLIAANPNTSADTLRFLADVAANPHTPQDVLMALIENEKTPLSVIEKLAKSTDATVSNFAKARLTQQKASSQ